jgi:hypothetical protein
MGALSYLVSVLIKLDVGTCFLHILDTVERISVDDGSVMIFEPLDFFLIVPDPLHRGVFDTYRATINGVSCILITG